MLVIDRETLEAVMPRIGGSKGAKQARIIDALAPVIHDTLDPLRDQHAAQGRPSAGAARP